MIFIGYWKALVLYFSEKGKAVFLWAKKLMERWYLLITDKFLFWTFRWWEIRSFLQPKYDGKMIYIWSFSAFHDTPGLGKNGFPCSAGDEVVPCCKESKVEKTSGNIWILLIILPAIFNLIWWKCVFWQSW